MKDKIENIKERNRIFNNLMTGVELSKPEAEYMIGIIKQRCKHLISVDEKICLRCGVPHKEIKREGSNGCSSRGHYYPKHLWK